MGWTCWKERVLTFVNFSHYHAMNGKLILLKKVLFAVVLVLLGSAVTKFADYRKYRSHEVSFRKWAKINLILNQIDRNYVDPIDAKAFSEKVIPLMMNELDPHSVYMPPTVLQDAEDELEGHFGGIGITFNVPNDTAIVIGIIASGPSERAGVMTGDRILKVSGRSIAGVKMPQDSMVRLMRGPSGTTVDLEILRDGEIVPFTIKRDIIPVKSVDVSYMIDDTTGYIKLSKFTRTSYLEFMTAAPDMVERGMKKLIFDLRDNTGGYLDQALLLSNEFLAKGEMIVYMEGVHRPRQEFTADGSGSCRGIRLYVLIDENSASSSEIFAGAIQDNDRGIVVGRRSFGKGLVQEPVNFNDNSGIRLTVARYYTPSGRCIQKPYENGVEDYMYDIYERYRHGEMMDVDSIPHNDSLVFYTKKGRVVYGGGGIIPDIFVPVDTVGVTDLLVKINRQSLQMKYAINFADRYRKELRDIQDLESLDRLFRSVNLENDFKNYLRNKDMDIPAGEWEISGHIIMTQVRAVTGRYSSLDDNAFYPIYSEIDNVIQAAVTAE